MTDYYTRLSQLGCNVEEIKKMNFTEEMLRGLVEGLERLKERNPQRWMEMEK